MNITKQRANSLCWQRSHAIGTNCWN